MSDKPIPDVDIILIGAEEWTDDDCDDDSWGVSDDEEPDDE